MCVTISLASGGNYPLDTAALAIGGDGAGGFYTSTFPLHGRSGIRYLHAVRTTSLIPALSIRRRTDHRRLRFDALCRSSGAGCRPPAERDCDMTHRIKACGAKLVGGKLGARHEAVFRGYVLFCGTPQCSLDSESQRQIPMRELSHPPASPKFDAFCARLERDGAELESLEDQCRRQIDALDFCKPAVRALQRT